MVERRLLEAMEKLKIIDCHEHLAPESDRLKTDVDIFTLFSHYTKGDLLRAGMSEPEYRGLFDRECPLETRWRKFAPYWERIRFTSYARAALIAAEKFYGAADINEKTYADISARIKALYTPGIYERVLGDACGIKTALTQCWRTDLGTPLLTPIMPLHYPMETWPDITHPAFDPGAPVYSLDDYLDAFRKYVLRVKTEGAVGLKLFSSPYRAPDREAARNVFERLRTGALDRIRRDTDISDALQDYVLDEMVTYAGTQDLTIAVHTGYWGDFRRLDPTHMIPLLMRHPDIRFDIYHIGYPYVREALMMGKGFSNVWLNFCWTHIISQEFAVNALDEAVDLVPSNKILAFGGDYEESVEKIYGHLVMARENVARVLGRRIKAGTMTEDQALKLLPLWFHDNAVELYRLKV